MIVKGVSTWNKNNHSPRLTVAAEIVSKRINVSHYSHANADVFEVTDIKKYNHAVAKLFCIFGIVLIVLGIPLLAIIAMVVYSLVIEKKYKKSR